MANQLTSAIMERALLGRKIKLFVLGFSVFFIFLEIITRDQRSSMISLQVNFESK